MVETIGMKFYKLCIDILKLTEVIVDIKHSFEDIPLETRQSHYFCTFFTLFPSNNLVGPLSNEISSQAHISFYLRSLSFM